MLGNWIKNKINPSQPAISREEQSSNTTERRYTYNWYYRNVEILNRAVNMIIDDAAEVNFIVGENDASIGEREEKKVRFPLKKGIREKTVERLLNDQPNPYQDVNSFRRLIIMDLLMDGNAFIYFDGASLYCLPAKNVVIHSDSKEFISHYTYSPDNINYEPSEIVHIKDNNAESIFRGVSRLKSCVRSLDLLREMRGFQDNFFSNGAVPGLTLKTPDTLSSKIKERMKQEWTNNYKPGTGGRKPVILDGGMSIDPISNESFRDLDFQESTVALEKTILKSVGVPPVLIDSGNNANITPNHRLYYLETIVPILDKITSAFKGYFGFEVEKDLLGIAALQPEMKEEAAYVTTLVNGGILTPNEGREKLGEKPLEGHDELRIPQNIAGSATNPSDGGRPEDETDEQT